MQGKIVKGIAGFYYVDTPAGRVYECRAKGIFRNQNIKPLVGDDVLIDVIDEEKATGNVISVLPRKNQLLRPPVANVDQALILFAIVKPDPSYNLLDRFLIMMGQQNLPVVICFNKQDIATPQEQKALLDAYEKCGYRVMFISVTDHLGITEIEDVLRGKTTVIAGPSGVGKSSLINALMNRKSYARISATPGKTQTINYYSINDEMYLVDLPGYGYAKVSEQEKIKWGQLIERYLHSSAQLKAVFLLIDIRHAPSENDRIMYQWIVDQGFHPIIIATKLDKIKRSQVQKQMKVLREGLKLIPGTTIIPFSSQTKQGRDEIWDMVENQFLNQ